VKKMMDMVTDENLDNYNNINDCYQAFEAIRRSRSRFGLFKKIYRAPIAANLYKDDLKKLNIDV